MASAFLAKFVDQVYLCFGCRNCWLHHERGICGPGMDAKERASAIARACSLTTWTTSHSHSKPFARERSGFVKQLMSSPNLAAVVKTVATV